MKILSLFLVYFFSNVQSQSELNYFYSDDWLNLMIAAENNTVIDVAKALGANTLVTLLDQAGLTKKLSGEGPFTLFAPTDAAFTSLPPKVLNFFKRHPRLLAKILLYHVNPSNTSSKDFKNEKLLKSLLKNIDIRINIYAKNNVTTATGIPISKVDQNASNGVVHLVDGVLYQIPVFNIVKVLEYAPDFWLLNVAIKMANLRDKLSGDGPFTLFAPTNSAFKKLPKSVLKELLHNKTALAEVLSYHVVMGTYYSAGLTNGSVPTAEGSSVKVTISDHKISINNASVTYPDVPVTNGVMQVIDQVLFPPESKFMIDLESPFTYQSLDNDIFNFVINNELEDNKINKFEKFL